MKLLYFAWVREMVGVAEEEVTPPEGIVTAGDLMGWLAGRDEGYAAAFAEADLIRIALDRAHAEADQPIAGVREVAFFPPMTGG